MRSQRRLIAALLVLVTCTAGLSAQSGTFGDSPRPVIRSYQLTVTTNVRGADVFLDGVRQRQTTPVTFNLRPGTYTIRVEAEGYQTWLTTVRLDRNQTIRAELIPSFATVILEIPRDLLNDRVRDPWRLIDFYLDGRLQRRTRIEVEPGYHLVTVVSGGLKIEQEFFFQAGRTYTVETIMRLAFYPQR